MKSSAHNDSPGPRRRISGSTNHRSRASSRSRTASRAWCSRFRSMVSGLRIWARGSWGWGLIRRRWWRGGWGWGGGWGGWGRYVFVYISFIPFSLAYEPLALRLMWEWEWDGDIPCGGRVKKSQEENPMNKKYKLADISHLMISSFW